MSDDLRLLLENIERQAIVNLSVIEVGQRLNDPNERMRAAMRGMSQSFDELDEAARRLLSQVKRWSGNG